MLCKRISEVRFSGSELGEVLANGDSGEQAQFFSKFSQEMMDLPQHNREFQCQMIANDIGSELDDELNVATVLGLILAAMKVNGDAGDKKQD